MTHSPLHTRIVVAAALLSLASFAEAQSSTVKNPPRLVPNVVESARIPIGIDSGSPLNSNTLPLGTPVPPNASEGRVEQQTRSAAARAAARPLPLAQTSNECLSAQDMALRQAMSNCSNISNRADRATCAAEASRANRDNISASPVALPDSGFVGSSATPTSRAAATATGTRTGTKC